MAYIFVKCAIFRLLSVLIIQTYFVADEYWQSLEVAHSTAFGYGYRTWEFEKHVRSSIYPYLFVLLYRVLDYLRIDSLMSVVYVPRIIQALLSAAADTCYYRWCQSLQFSPQLTWITIIFDWFSFYCGSRTLINTFEQNMVAFGLYSFPWHPKPSQRPYLFATIVAVVCFIRPTACIVWGPFCFVWLLRSDFKSKQSILLTFIQTGCVVTFILCAIDSIFYGTLTLTPLNFINMNVFKGVACFYGSHPFHWYFTQGVPVVLGAFTLPFLLQVLQTTGLCCHATIPIVRSKQRLNVMLLTTVTCSLTLYSLVPHKEFRFIASLLPMMKVMALQGISTFLRSGKKRKLLELAVILGWAVPVVLFGQLHQRGSLSVMRTLASDAAKAPNKTALLFLTPCHATPLYSHLHTPVPTRFITCYPPLTSHDQDESETFFEQPVAWLDEYWNDTTTVRPTHIVMFDCLAPALTEFLSTKNFSLSETFFHTIFPDGRTGSYIEIYKIKNNDT